MGDQTPGEIEKVIPQGSVLTAPSFHEAPAVVFTKLYGTVEGDKSERVLELNITVRANTAREALDQLMDAATYAKGKYKMSMLNPMSRKAPEQPAASQAQAPTRAPGKPGSPSAPSAPTPQSAPRPPEKQQQVTPTILMFHCTKMEVTPEADGKVTLKWYEAGHKYPDIYTTRTYEKALELLQSTGETWTMDYIKSAFVYDQFFAHDVYYKLSEKKNSKGNPYKDIVEIRTAQI